MARPIKGRRVCCLPHNNRFGPLGLRGARRGGIQMTVDEYETIRLIDHLGCNQEECARQMQVARTTVQGIYDRARRKLAKALVDGETLTITGGEYTLYGENQSDPACRHACRRHLHGNPEEPAGGESLL